ncbi:MAG: SGNH/GDSL hydrolase family protein [Eubacteriales bacterium]|jgi:hypothetical protein|nr:hypothetical protein [Clostridiales bacterium]
MRVYEIPCAPFEVSGLVDPQPGRFWRLPEGIIDRVNEGVAYHARQTAGACVRFATDSAVLRLDVRLREYTAWTHMTVRGIAGCDIFADGAFVASAGPAVTGDLAYSCEVRLPGGAMHEIRVNLPLFATVESIEIALDDAAAVSAPAPYRFGLPVVFYGSSITNGACASIPANAYPTMLAMRMGFEEYNLGFSGSARGEDIMAEYIASLDMAAFVYDYDHNAPSAAHLQATHEKLYRTVRAKRPDVPIIMLSKPDFDSDPAGNATRRDIIKRTYEQAVAGGDSLVRFIDGETLFGFDEARQHCTTDGCHPNDLGFCRMADAVMPILAQMLAACAAN